MDWCSDDEYVPEGRDVGPFKNINNYEFEKEMKSRYNDGFREGLSTGSNECFLHDLWRGFSSSFEILTKAFQLHFIIDRSINHYKDIQLSDMEKYTLKQIHKLSGLLANKISSNLDKDLKSNKSTAIDEHLNQMKAPIVNSFLTASALQQDDQIGDACQRRHFLEELSLICGYFNEQKDADCLRDTQVEEILNLLEEFNGVERI